MTGMLEIPTILTLIDGSVECHDSICGKNIAEKMKHLPLMNSAKDKTFDM